MERELFRNVRSVFLAKAMEFTSNACKGQYQDVNLLRWS